MSRSAQESLNRIDELRRDAERYRWLRETNTSSHRDIFEGAAHIGSIDCIMVQGQPDSAVAVSPEEMDEVIDAAMGRWPI